MTSGRPVVSQWARPLVATTSSSGARLIRMRSSEPSSWSAANRRSSANRLANSAASHRIAGPICLSSGRFGPTANGISVTTTRKNSTPISAPPPTRTAMRMSRMRIAARAVMTPASPSRNSRAVSSPMRAVGGRQDEAAPGQMRPHQAGEAVLGGGVERAGGLVQQPDRALDGDEAGDRQPPALACRQVGGGQIGQFVEADRGEGWVDICGLGAQKSGPKSQVFGDRQRRFQGVQVAEIVRLLGDGQFRIAAFQAELALGEADQADDGAQQRRFPGAVAAGDRQSLAGGHGKAKRLRTRRGRRGDRPDRQRKAASARS